MIEIVDYDETWPAQFERLRSRLAEALGPVVLRIEHVGSTAVPGLAAKPKLDVDVVVATAREVAKAIEGLAEVGFEHQGDLGVPGREAFKGPDGGDLYHVYVCVEGMEPLREHLVFRDYLRSHPEAAADYVDLKRELAARFPADRDAYSRGKSAFVRSIVER